MKKAYIFGGGSFVLITLWICLRATNVIQFFNLPTSSMNPSIPMGSYMITSVWKEPKRLDCIAYWVDTIPYPDMPGAHSYQFKRLCGLPGDRIELRNGVLYVNGMLMDSSLHLNRTYFMTLTRAKQLANDYHFLINDDSNMQYSPLDIEGSVIGQDSAYILFDQQLAKKEHLGDFAFEPQGTDTGHMFKDFNPAWNKDQLGPITVPEDSYFVMGDNRDNALDSRYLGFIKKADFRGTLVGHWHW